MSLLFDERLGYTNPVFAREFRTRWRRPLTYLILLGYFLFWGWIAWEFYLTYKAGLNPNGSPGPWGLSGHALFTQINWLQMILWVFGAPILAAPSITGEKERRMLTELLLSDLTARDIVYGKFYSILAFILVLLIGPLLLTVVWFLPTGVPPIEFLQAFAMQACVATIGVATGLMCSSQSRKTTAALGSALLLGGVGGCLLLPLLSLLFSVSSFSIFCCAIVLWCSTRGLLGTATTEVELAVCEKDPFRHKRYTFSPPSTYSSTENLSALFQTPLTEQTKAVNWPPSQRDSLRAQNPTDAREVWGEVESPREDDFAFRPITRLRDPKTAANEAKEAWFSAITMGWLRRWIESNPVLQREWRVRRRTEILHSPTSLVALFGLGVVIALLTRGISHEVYWHCTTLFVLVVAAFCAINASMSFIRERDQGTLPMLLLTRLSPREIVWGKQSIPLAFGLARFTPWLLLFLGCGSLQPVQAVSSVLLILAAGWCAAAFGILLSYFFRTTTFAAMGALGGFLLTFLLTPPLLGSENGRVVSGLAWIAIGPRMSENLLSGSIPRLPLEMTQALYLFGIGTILLWLVARRIRPALLDRESRSLLNLDLSRNLT